jgi:ATP-binding cassette subfamily F protein uup
MNVLDVSDLCKSCGQTRILSGVDLTLGELEKVGLVGRNGSGKSTLLRIIAGLEEADSGRVTRRRGLTIAYLPQKPSLDPDATVRGVLEGQLGESRARLGRYQEVVRALNTAGDEDLSKLLAEQQQLQSWLDHHGAWNLSYRIDEICDRFGVPNPDVRCGALSGGWAQRVALAGLLLNRPDVVLLDEPTNQLDAETVEWLEGELLDYRGAVLLVTHDRYFLDRVVSRILELESGALTTYSGGYTAYLQRKSERLAQTERTQERLLNLLREEEAWLRRGAKARTTKQKARIDRAEELRSRAVTTTQRELALSFSAGRRLGGTVLEASGLRVEIAGRVLVRNLDFILGRGDRVGILGPNGCGKTTLLKTLLGQLAPAAGGVTIGGNTRIGYLDQTRCGLDDAETVSRTLGEGDWITMTGRNAEKRHKIGYLEQFLFSRQDQQKPVSTLSGGERARLLLAKLMLAGANLLVLDEPTNDLDIPTLQVLDEALAGFQGSVLTVTHDRYFLDRVATGILHFGGNATVTYYEGNYEVFSALRAQKCEEPPPTRKSAPTPPSSAHDRPKQAGLSYREARELESVEQEIEAAETRKRQIEAALADPSGIAGREELETLARELAGLEARLEALLGTWEGLEAKRV